MSKSYIHETPIAKVYNIEARAKDCATFLIETANRSDKPSNAYANLFPNIGGSTYMQKVFKNILDGRHMDNLHMFSYSKGDLDIPELLTIEDIVIDGKYLPFTLPQMLKKPWVNLSSMVGTNSLNRFGSVELVDVPKAISLVVRAFLSASYNDSRDWLPPKISSLLIELYIYSVGKVLGRMFNLDYSELDLVQYVFAWYYANLLGDSRDNPKDPTLLRRNRNLFLSMGSLEIDDLHSKILTILGDRKMSVEIAIEIISTIGPKRMHGLTYSLFVKSFAVSSMDNISTYIALDYPPYLLHQLLKVESGSKHPIFGEVYKTRFKKPDVARTLDLLVVTKSIYGISR